MNPREKLETAIERAIALLDTMDGDTDKEPEETDHSNSEDDFFEMNGAREPNLDMDREPSLGATTTFSQVKWATHGGYHWGGAGWLSVSDLEQDAEDEPSLGSLVCVGSCSPEASGGIGFSQVAWAAGGVHDLEEEHDGSEPDVDDEPSLGWTVSHTLGGTDDQEENYRDSEATGLTGSWS